MKNQSKESLVSKIENQQASIKALDAIKTEVNAYNDPQLQAKLSELTSKMDTDLLYFREAIDVVSTNVFADGVVTSSEISMLDSFDDFMYTVVMELKSKISNLRAAGVVVPASLIQHCDFLEIKMREAQKNTHDARGFNAKSENNYDGMYSAEKALQMQFTPSAHVVQNNNAKRRISLRMNGNQEAAKLLKEVGLFQEVSQETLATKRFRDAEYGRVK